MTRIFVASIMTVAFASSTFAAEVAPAAAASPSAPKVTARKVPVIAPAAHETGPKTLTFEEFRQLSTADAEAYLEDLRQFALKVEAEHAGQVAAQNLWMTLLLAQAHAAAGTQCVYAGYVMTNETDCKNHNAPSKWVTPDGTEKTLCAGKTTCNPMLYGFGPSGDGICLPKSSASTTACDSAYRHIPNYGGADIAKQLNSPKLKSEFNKQATQVKSYCSSTSSDSQKKMCSYVSDRSSYLSGKIAAAGKGGAAKKAETPAPAVKNAEKVAPKVADKDAVKKPEPKPAPAPPAAKAAPAPPTASTGRNGAPGAPGSSGGNAETPAPSAGRTGAAGTPAPAAPAAPAPAPKPAVPPKPEKKLSTDGCIRSKEDYAAQKSKFTVASLRTMDSSPAYFAVTGMVDGAIKLRMDGDKLVVSTHVWPPKGFTDGKTIIKESKADEICFDKTKPGFLKLHFTDGDTKMVEMTAKGVKFYKDADSGLEFESSNIGTYNQVKQKVEDQRKVEKGGVQ